MVSLRPLARRLLAKAYMRMEAAAAGAHQENCRRKMAADAANSVFSLTARLNYNGRETDSIQVGHSCVINGDLMVYIMAGRIKIGHHCFVGPNTRIWSAATIAIGNYVQIAHNVN